MGKFRYDHSTTAEFDDRVLAHVQLVISAKLRRREAFMFSWVDDDAVGNGRSSVWVHPRAVVSFKFFGKRPPSINRAWVDALMKTANSPTGLLVVPEPPDDSR